MKALIAVFLVLGCIFRAGGQELKQHDPISSYSFFGSFSNDSSHIILGVAENRRLIDAGMDYSRRLGRRSLYSWRYQVEVIPLELLQNPKLTTTVTYTVTGNPTSVNSPAGTFQFSALQARQCASQSNSGTYFEIGANGQEIPVGTYTMSSVCSHPWTYGFGVSPLGQKVNFLPRNRLQPYAALNAGFVAFTKTIPSDSATMFNFSFEFGGGVEWNTRPGRAWSVDYRLHHISNANRGVSNPGVDNGTFRVAYSFWR